MVAPVLGEVVLPDAVRVVDGEDDQVVLGDGRRVGACQRLGLNTLDRPPDIDQTVAPLAAQRLAQVVSKYDSEQASV